MNFLVRKTIESTLTVFAAITLTVILLSSIPGDPAVADLMQASSSTESLERRRLEMHLDESVLQQYLRLMSNFVRGEWGVSWFGAQPVRILISQGAIGSLELLVLALPIAIVCGGGMGMFPYLLYPSLARIVRIFGRIFLVAPVVVIGSVILILSVHIPSVFPRFPSLLPSLTLGLNLAGVISYNIDSHLGQSEFRTLYLALKARGVSQTRIFLRHFLPLIAVSISQMLALQAGYIVTGVPVIEILFSRTGLGRLLITAILNKDVPVVLVVVALTSIWVVFVTTAADILHMLLDPRLRGQRIG